MRAIFSGFEWFIIAFFLVFSFCLYIVIRKSKIKGKIGERFVVAKLKKGLGSEYCILNDIYLPLSDGRTTQVDHIVVSSFGVFVIETKNYSGWIFANERSPVWTQTIYREKHTFQNPIRQNYRHLCALSEDLGIPKNVMHGIVVFIGDCQFKTEMPRGVVFGRQLVEHIKSFAVKIIKDEQVGELAEAIREWDASVTKTQRAHHVGNLRRRLANRRNPARG